MIAGGMLAAAAWAQPPATQAGVSAKAGVSATAAVNSVSSHDEYARGQALFSGSVDLHGRIYTHAVDMPPRVVRCSNCHAVADGPEVARSLAPRLTPSLLVLPHARRGGPASHYSRDSFCALLRKGVDPAFVMISVEMPRYAIDDDDCRALWRYLTGSGPNGSGPNGSDPTHSDHD